MFVDVEPCRSDVKRYRGSDDNTREFSMFCSLLVTVLLQHGRRSRGMRGTSPPEFVVGDATANCPLRLLSYKYKKERSVAFKIRQNPFSAGALPRTPLGAHDAPPDPLVGWRGDNPHHTLPHSAATHLRCSPCVPPSEFQPDLSQCYSVLTITLYSRRQNERRWKYNITKFTLSLQGLLSQHISV